MNNLSEFKRACRSSLIHHDTAVWRFTDFIKLPAFAAIKTRFNLSSKDANRPDKLITTYFKVVIRLLRPYATETVTTREDNEIGSFKWGSVTQSDISQWLQYLSLQCGGVYNEQMLRGLIFEDINLTVRITMRRCWADSQEGTLEDLTHQAQSAVDLQGGNWKTARKDGQWTKFVSRNTKGSDGRGKPCCTSAGEEHGTPSSSERNEPLSQRSWE